MPVIWRPMAANQKRGRGTRKASKYLRVDFEVVMGSNLVTCFRRAGSSLRVLLGSERAHLRLTFYKCHIGESGIGVEKK